MTRVRATKESMGCMLLKVNKSLWYSNVPLNHMIMVSDVLYDDIVETILKPLVGVLKCGTRVSDLPDEVNEIIEKEYIKLKDSEVIVIEVYNIKE